MIAPSLQVYLLLRLLKGLRHGTIPRGEIEIVMVGAEFLFIGFSTPARALPMDARRPKSG